MGLCTGGGFSGIPIAPQVVEFGLVGEEVGFRRCFLQSVGEEGVGFIFVAFAECDADEADGGRDEVFILGE